MKKSKSIILCITLMTFLLSSTAYAGVRVVTPDEYNPRTMTLEERARWVDENVEPTLGRLDLSPNLVSPFAIDANWRYSQPVDSFIGPDQYTVGTLTTAIKYKVDTAQYSVEDWGTVIFSAGVVAPTAWVSEQTFDSFWIQEPGNYRMLYEAWYVDPSGGQFIEHWYNIHGDGQYSIREVKGIGEEYIPDDPE